MKTITCNLPDSIYQALTERVRTENASLDHVVSVALSQCLGRPLHTLFQVSTSAALVEGLYQGAVQVSRLLRHGDFGLGTFIDLDGEMVVLEGVCYRVSSSGAVAVVEGHRLIPYAVVTRFRADFTMGCKQLNRLELLTSACDRLRESDNAFYAFRIDGTFRVVRTRAMRPVAVGVGLRSAASEQREFTFEGEQGTLVGFWSPGFAGSFSVPGYHFHFLSKDRRKGGHVLECDLLAGTIGGCEIHEMHVSLPETTEFLKADLTRDPSADLKSAERNHE